MFDILTVDWSIFAGPIIDCCICAGVFHSRGMSTSQRGWATPLDDLLPSVCSICTWNVLLRWNYCNAKSAIATNQVLTKWIGQDSSLEIVSIVPLCCLHRLCSSDGNVPPHAKLYPQPWRWLLLCLCGGPWDRACVSFKQASVQLGWLTSLIFNPLGIVPFPDTCLKITWAQNKTITILEPVWLQA